MSDIGRKNVSPRAQDVTPNNMKSTQERLRDTTNKAGGSAAGASKSGSQSTSGSKAGTQGNSAYGRK